MLHPGVVQGSAYLILVHHFFFVLNSLENPSYLLHNCPSTLNHPMLPHILHTRKIITASDSDRISLLLQRPESPWLLLSYTAARCRPSFVSSTVR